VKSLIFILIAPVILATSNRLYALNFFDFDVDPYATEGRGIAEFEGTVSSVPDGLPAEGDSGAAATKWLTRTSLEFNYGLTHSFDVGYQLDLARPEDGSLEYAGSQFRAHQSFFDKAELPVDLGWVSELEWIRSPRFSEDTLELDFHPVVERDFGRFTIVLNPTFEEALVGPDQWQSIGFSYAGKMTYRWMRAISPGIEFYGEIGKITNPLRLSDQQHYLVPTVYVRLPNHVRFNVGVGFGLTSASDDVITKLQLEYDFATD
jgi:hypothetical protein